MQSKKSMLIETFLNTFSGFVVSYIITLILHADMSTMSPMLITWIFTVVSLIRSYVWRMIFNKRHAKKVLTTAVETC